MQASDGNNWALNSRRANLFNYFLFRHLFSNILSFTIFWCLNGTFMPCHPENFFLVIVQLSARFFLFYQLVENFLDFPAFISSLLHLKHSVCSLFHGSKSFRSWRCSFISWILKIILILSIKSLLESHSSLILSVSLVLFVLFTLSSLRFLFHVPKIVHPNSHSDVIRKLTGSNWLNMVPKLLSALDIDQILLVRSQIFQDKLLNLRHDCHWFFLDHLKWWNWLWEKTFDIGDEL